MLDNKQYAILYAVMLSIVPFASWLSIALVAFITLRKGAKPGFEVFLPAAVIHSVPLMMLVSVDSALINTLIAYLSCYLAALILRKTAKWQAVAGVFLLQSFVGFFFIDYLLPNFAVDQLVQLKKMLTHYPEYQQYIEHGIQNISSGVMAQLFLGIQVLGIMVSSLISLLLARYIQAKLFVPEGLKAELMEFRGGRFAFFILMGISIASYYEYPVTINLLPLTLCYFFLSGFNLAYFVLVRKWGIKTAVLMILLIILQPILIIFIYIILGLLDSLFNFRLYLPGKARKSI